MKLDFFGSLFLYAGIHSEYLAHMFAVNLCHWENGNIFVPALIRSYSRLCLFFLPVQEESRICCENILFCSWWKNTFCKQLSGDNVVDCVLHMQAKEGRLEQYCEYLPFLQVNKLIFVPGKCSPKMDLALLKKNLSRCSKEKVSSTSAVGWLWGFCSLVSSNASCIALLKKIVPRGERLLFNVAYRHVYWVEEIVWKCLLKSNQLWLPMCASCCLFFTFLNNNPVVLFSCRLFREQMTGSST